MFNFSFGELLILGVIGLIVIGPKQLPQVAKVLVRTLNEFKKAMKDVTSSVTDEIKVDVLKDLNTNSIAKTATQVLLEDEKPSEKKSDG